MTGTAQTEAAELHQIYKLGVVPIPTNRPMIRMLDRPTHLQDRGRQVRGRHRRHRRAARGRASRFSSARPAVAKSELLSGLLLRKGIPHEVLNAKQHDRRGRKIVASGRGKGAVTVATNMAGRGTDIMLGGNPEFTADQDPAREGPDAGRDARRSTRQPGTDALENAKAEVGDQGARRGHRARRSLRARHRAARVAAHRQPAARPGRPAGRPGRVPLLPLPRRRPDGPLQRRAGRGDDEHAAPARGRPDRGQDGLQVDRRVNAQTQVEAAELRDPQERPQVRRGHEQAAHRHLRRAPRGAQRRSTSRTRSGR